MPQITVEYSAALAGTFDRRGFALALHTEATPLLDTKLDSFKTRFARIDEGVIADGSPTQTMVHVEMAILSGRDTETKQELTALVLRLARQNLTPPDGLTVQFTVEIRDLDRTTYGKHVHE